MKEKILVDIIKEFNITLQEISDFFVNKGLTINTTPETKISNEIYLLIKDKFYTSNNKTSVYSDMGNSTKAYSNENNATELYNDEVKSTKTYEDENITDKTKLYNDKTFSNISRARKHILNIGDFITLKGKEYKIIDVISEQTKEAVIYKILDQSKNIFVLKLYNEVSEKEEPNGETLERIKNIKDADILELIDFGVGFEKYLDKYCFEISVFAKGGDLLNVNNFKEKYTPQFIENTIVKEIFLGLKTLHSNGIYHCDLKPNNIFYLDEEQTDIVIGDYGNAKTKDLEFKQEIHISSIVFATPFYVAPELASSKAISAKADYFSFGMILLHLLYPEQFANDNNYKSVEKSKVNKIFKNIISSKEVIRYNPEYERLNKLIAGLTLSVFDNRWGEREVQKWIDGKDDELEVKYLSVKTATINLSGNQIIKTEDDLIDYLITNENWKQELLEDKITKQELDNWLNVNYKKDKRVEINNLLKYTNEVIDINVDKNVAKNEKIDYTKQAFIRFLRPEFPIFINEYTFKLTDENISDNLNKLISKLDKEWKLLSTEKIRFVLFQVEFSLRRLMITSNQEARFYINNLLIKIYSGLFIKKNKFDANDFKSEIAKAITIKDEKDSLKKIINLFYTFNSKRTFNYKKTTCKTLEELGLFFVENENLFNNIKIQIEKERFLQKINKIELSNLSYIEFIFEVFKHKSIAEIEYTGLTFDKHRDYKVNYKYYKSLTKFLKSKGIQKEFTSRSDKDELFTYHRKFFQKFGNVYDAFIEAIRTKHNISNLSSSNENLLKTGFIKDSKRQYFKVYQGQLLAFITLIFIVLGIKYIQYINTYHPPVQTNNQTNLNQNSNQNSNSNSNSNKSSNSYTNKNPVNTNNSNKNEEKHKIINSISNYYRNHQNLRSGNHNISINGKTHETSLIKIGNYSLIQYEKYPNKWINGIGGEKFWKFKNSNQLYSIVNSNKVNKIIELKEHLIGNWKVQNENSYYNFNINGNGFYTNSRNKQFNFKWTIKNSQRVLEIHLTDDNSVWSWKINKVKFGNIEMYSPNHNINRTITKY